MENNFQVILLGLVRKSKQSFLGLLRRNGVLVSPNVSVDTLTNMLLKAMEKSESFKREAVVMMSGLIGSGDSSFANFLDEVPLGQPTFGSSNPFGSLPKFDSDTFSTTTSSTTTPKKDFADTTAGKVTGSLLGLFDKYITNKELDVRKTEAQTGGKISDNKVKLEEINLDLNPDGTPNKSNTGLYVGLGVGVLALIGLLVYLKTKKK